MLLRAARLGATGLDYAPPLVCLLAPCFMLPQRPPGLSAILLSSAAAFAAVKFVGAGYLIYLGVRVIRAKNPALTLKHAAPAPLPRLIIDGMIISLFNPKIAIFFLAFLPQFVDPSAGSGAGSVAGSVTLQVLWLGLIYCGLAFLTDSGYALLAGRVKRLITGRSYAQKLFAGPLPRYGVGGVYIGLGINAALTDLSAVGRQR